MSNVVWNSLYMCVCVCASLHAHTLFIHLPYSLFLENISPKKAVCGIGGF